MRRFIVEVVLDAFLLLVIVLFLGIISVAQPFPFGTGSAPVVALRGAGLLGFVSWAAILVLVNRFARPGPRRADRPAAVLDDGLLRRDHQRDRDLASPRSSRRSRSRTVAEPTLLWVIVAAALYTAPVHRHGRRPRPEPAGPRRRPEPRRSGASSSRCPRRGATRSSRTCASSRSTTRSTRPASTSPWPTRRSADPALVRPGRPRRDGRPRRRDRAGSGSGRCSSSSARPT